MASPTATLPRTPLSQRPVSQRPRVLASWLADRGEAVAPPLTPTRLPRGLTNDTWMVEDRTGKRWVLRERGRGDIRGFGREAGTIRAMATAGYPVARVIGHGDGRRGAPFIVTEWVAGTTLHDEDDAIRVPLEQRHRWGVRAAEALGRLHAVDPRSLDLTPFSTGYTERQLAAVSDAWARCGSSGVHDAAWRAVRSRLVARRPQRESRAALVHGDFHLGNLVFDDDEVVAVLDWERCTIGNPLADLAWLLNSWAPVDDSPGGWPAVPTRAGGFPTGDELIAVYREHRSISLDDLDYYRALAHWTAATLIQATESSSRAKGCGSVAPPSVIDEAIRERLFAASTFRWGRR